MRTLAEILSAFGMGLSEQEVKALTPEKLRDHAAGLKNNKEGGQQHGGRDTGSGADHTCSL